MKLSHEKVESIRRSAEKERLRQHKTRKTIEEAARTEELEGELTVMAGRKREKALHHYIRVNFRKVSTRWKAKIT